MTSNTPKPMPGAEFLLLPDMDFFDAVSSGMLPVDVIPLYALLAGIYQAVGRRPAYSAALASAQLVRALEHLGFDAELIPACTAVYRQDRTHVTDIGVYQQPPVVRDDGVTDGHVVVWSNTFRRCIDLGVCNQHTLLETSNGRTLTSPIVLPMAGGIKQLLDEASGAATLRLPFVFGWNFFPEWRSRFDPFLSYHATAINQGGIALAKVAVGLLSALSVYSNLTELEQLYPRLGALLSGQADLPLAGAEIALNEPTSDRGTESGPTHNDIHRGPT